MKTKRDRQRETAAMPRCACGNVPKLGTPYCNRCDPQDTPPDEVAMERERFLALFDAWYRKPGAAILAGELESAVRSGETVEQFQARLREQGR